MARTDFAFLFASTGSGNGQVESPGGVAVFIDGNILVSDTGNNRVEVYSAIGAYQYGFGK